MVSPKIMTWASTALMWPKESCQQARDGVSRPAAGSIAAIHGASGDDTNASIIAPPGPALMAVNLWAKTTGTTAFSNSSDR